MKNLFILFCCFFLSATVTFGQSKIVSGTVTDAKNGEPIKGASITVKEIPNVGTSSDEQGKFKLSVPDNGKNITVSIVGYNPQTLAIAANSNLNIQLISSEQQLGEVVVTALGIKKQTRSLTYATQVVSTEDINRVKDPTGNIMNSLNGKVSNLVITPSGSGPGGAVRVVMRGNRSINGNNNALIVIDGVPIDNTMSTEAAGGGSANTLGTQTKSISSSYSGMDGASSINPEDVENVTVLKGPAAAALYGSRAANGALLITTKTGKAGKMAINYSGGISIDNPFFLNKFQNEYGRGNGGVASKNSGQSWGAKTQTYPDNVSSFYNRGFTLNNSVDVSGGSEKMRGYVSYDNNITKGIIPENDLKKNNLNLRINGKIVPKLSMDVKMTYSDQKIDHLPRLGDQGINNEIYIAPRDLSIDSIKNYETTNIVTGQPSPVYWTNSSIFQNPYWDAYRMNVSQQRTRQMILGSLKYEFTDWLSLQARYSLDTYNDLLRGTYYSGTTLAPFNQSGGMLQEAAINHLERNMDVLLSGKNDIVKDLSVSYNVGASILDQKANNKTTTANGLNVVNQFAFDYAKSLSVVTLPFRREIQSLYGNAQLNYKDMLYLDASLRNDWSSTLPPPYSFSYPSVGLSSILSSLFKMPKWVSFSKVRLAYTNVGNDADPYRTTQAYNYSQGAGNGFISIDPTQSIGSSLKPEKTKSFEIGTEWKFLNNRISLDGTYYQSNTINQLISIGVPAASLYSNRYINVGNIQNRGLELSLEFTPVLKDNFSWDSRINFSLNRNKVLSLIDGVSATTVSTSTNFGQLIIKPGGSYGDIYGYGWAKDPATGKYLINANGLPIATSNKDQLLGNFNPKYMLGWNNNFKYKHLSLNFQIDGRVGGIIMSGTDALSTYYGVSDATLPYREGGLILDGVHADGTPNTTTITAEKLWTTVSNNGRSSNYDEFFAFDATNFRLRELSVSYNFDLHSKTIKGLTVSITGRNLFFIYRGKSVLDIPGIGKRKLPIDPETAIGTSNFQGIESGLPPAIRSYGLNFRLSF